MTETPQGVELSVVGVLQRRDGMSESEAQEVLADLQTRMWEGEDPEDLLFEIGLEPDYLFDLF